ncbi:MAG: AMP-binding protein, partial [Gemmatimonadetes bacterium]|nr:AMP-binding protein [Gemmatimonadota bacterium]
MTNEPAFRAKQAMSHALAAVREGNTLRSQLAPIGERESVGGLLARNVARFGSHAVYAERVDGEFRAASWESFARDVTAFAAFLADSGVGPGTRVAIVSPNRGEMLIAEFATMGLGATYVPIFAGYPADQVQGLLAHATPTVVIVAGRAQLAGVYLGVGARALVTLDTVDAAALATLLQSTMVHYTSFRDAISAHPAGPADVATFLDAAARIDPDEPCLLNFTS